MRLCDKFVVQWRNKFSLNIKRSENWKILSAVGRASFNVNDVNVSGVTIVETGEIDE